MESVGLKKEETAYRTKWKDVIEVWKVWGKCGLKEGGNSVQDKVEGRNRDRGMESVGLKKEETAYRTKWKEWKM